MYMNNSVNGKVKAYTYRIPVVNLVSDPDSLNIRDSLGVVCISFTTMNYVYLTLDEVTGLRDNIDNALAELELEK